MSEARSPSAAVEAALLVVQAREAEIHAFAYLDPERARAEAGEACEGPLHGLTVGVKDIFDTADQPSEYGSPIYKGHRPRADAAAVALLRGAGAVVLGKTVTAELAWSFPGVTTNPHRSTHTPGGSSSGSAAAVASGMVDFAIGTQTAGSTIRPASFCGVFGLKPTFGLIPTAGMKQGAPSLDTVGIFANDPDIVDQVAAVLMVRELSPVSTEVRFVALAVEHIEEATPDCRAVLERAARAVEAPPRELPEAFLGLGDDQLVVQGYEGARSLAWELLNHPDQLSARLSGVLETGRRVEADRYDAALAHAARCRTEAMLDELFGDADVLIAPAALGEAPEGLATTGDPIFCRPWTLLGLPALSVPGGLGATGLPIGVQLIARPYGEALLSRAGRLLSARDWMISSWRVDRRRLAQRVMTTARARRLDTALPPVRSEQVSNACVTRELLAS